MLFKMIRIRREEVEVELDFIMLIMIRRQEVEGEFYFIYGDKD